MTLNEMQAKRSALIQDLNEIEDKLSLMNDLSADAKKKRAKEIKDLESMKASTVESIGDIEADIQDQMEAEKQRQLEQNNQAYVADYLSKNGQTVSNWLEFTNSYTQTIKTLTSKKVKFDGLDDEILDTESEKNANAISSWFSRLDFKQKTCDESVFNTVNKMVGLRLKQGNIKNALVETWQNNPELIEQLEKKDLVRLFKFILVRTAPPKARKSSGGQTRGNSIKAQVDQYLENLGEGVHSLSEYIDFHNSINTGTTKPTHQLVMNCRADKGGKFELSMNKANDQFTLTER